MLVDTSGILLLADAAGAGHQAAVAAVAADRQPVLSPFVLAEADYLLAKRFGSRAALTLARDVGRGTYELAPFDAGDVAAAVLVQERFSDLGIGLTDASVVVLADRYETAEVLTTDLRHFRALRWRSRRHFRILPADA